MHTRAMSRSVAIDPEPRCTVFHIGYVVGDLEVAKTDFQHLFGLHGWAETVHRPAHTWDPRNGHSALSPG